MTRDNLHSWIDTQLDAMGYSDDVTLLWGTLTFQVNFEAGRVILKIRERETLKETK
jgi:hypothetical protein